MGGRRARGFTLLELLVTIAIFAIVTTLAAPGLRTFTQNNRAAAQANEFIAALNLARNEAVTRGAIVSICASADGVSCSGVTEWTGGWLVFVDRVPPLGSLDNGPDGDELLRAWPALGSGGSLVGSRAAISWRPDGFVANALATTFELSIPGCRGQQGRSIGVNPQGRTSVLATGCEDG